MRILFVDSRIDGHHISYCRALINKSLDCGCNVALCTPQEIEVFDNRVHQIVFGENEKYYKWIMHIYNEAKRLKADIVHFLYGDHLYRYFGYELSKIGKIARVIITFHQVRRGFLHDISIRCISKRADCVVVHTDDLKDAFHSLKVSNVCHIEYPQFQESLITESKDNLRKNLGIVESDAKVLLALGATRMDKGLDILLKALNGVSSPFYLIIAGKEADFTLEFINREIINYKDRVILKLKFLSDLEFTECISCSDIVVLPYRKIFDGASGPLGEGVWQGKEIIGPNHKSLGRIITDHHLGKTFECESSESLQKCIDSACREKWVPDLKYEQYRKQLDPNVFATKYYNQYMNLLSGGQNGK